MKTSKFSKIPFILIGLILISFYGITELKAQDRSNIISICRKAASQLSYETMRKISPNTGEDSDYDLDYDSIIYDSGNNEVECRVSFSWSAKEYMLSSYRGTCQVWGKMYVYLDQSRNGQTKVKFIPKGKNDHAENCIKSHWANFAAGFSMYVLINQ